MSKWSFDGFRSAVLAIMAMAALSGAGSLHGTEAVPAPCNQLEKQAYQVLCASFLADSESTGGQTFVSAIAVDSFDDLKEQLETRENYGGNIIFLAEDIYIDEKKDTLLVPRGIVAVIGNPKNPPRIHIGGTKGAITAMRLAATDEVGARVRPRGFYSWHVEWVMSDAMRDVLKINPHFGVIHITHSIFRCLLPIIDELSGTYIRMQLEHTVDHNITNSMLIAHNHFYNRPAYNVTWYAPEADIFIGCYNLLLNGKIDSRCDQLGNLVIRDNSWHGTGALEFSARRSVPDPNNPFNYRASIVLLNIARVTISGNQAADPDAVLSFVFQYYPGDKITKFQNLNLQLVNNIALPEMNATQRQFYLNGVTYPLDREGHFTNFHFGGLVNMTCNPLFTVVRDGGFHPGVSPALSVIEANEDCTPPNITVTPSSASIPVTPVSIEVTTAVEPTNTITAQPSATVSISLVTVSSSPSPSPSQDNPHQEADNEALIYGGAGAGGVVLGLVAWELGWSLAYRYSKGRFQRFANRMALFLPYILQQLCSGKDTLPALIPAAEDDDAYSDTPPE